MTNLLQAIWVETLKARRSGMPLLTGLGFLLLPLVGGFFMIILKDPAFARRVGLISAKAQLMAGEASWPAFLALLAQAIAVGGLILFGFIATWVFGREHADRTVQTWLALPTPRSTIVLAKFFLVIAWSAILTAAVYLLSLAVGAAVSLPAVPAATIWQGSLTILVTALLTVPLVTPVAFFASAGHGYLPPLAATVLAILLAQVTAVAGWGDYFPWAIPALYAQGSQLAAISYPILFLAAAAGLAGTVIWWEKADQTG